MGYYDITEVYKKIKESNCPIAKEIKSTLVKDIPLTTPPTIIPTTPLTTPPTIIPTTPLTTPPTCILL